MNKCIKITSPEELINAIRDRQISVAENGILFYLAPIITKYQQEKRPLSKDEIRKIIETCKELIANLSSINDVSIQFDDSVSKDNINFSKLELTYSYLGNTALTPQEYLRFVEVAESELLPLLVLNTDGLPTFDLNKTQDENNLLLDLAFKSKVIDFIKKYNTSSKLTANKSTWEDIGVELNKLTPLLGTKSWTSWMVYKYMDTALRSVASSYISIPTGYFDKFHKEKQYRWNLKNSMLHSWTSEDEDLDELTQISQFLPLIFKQIPTYTILNKHLKKLDNDYIDFRIFTNGLNALRRVLLRHIDYKERKVLKNEGPYTKLRRALYTIKENPELSLQTIASVLLDDKSLNNNIIEEIRREDNLGFDALCSTLIALYGKQTGNKVEGIYQNHDFVKECIYQYVPSTCDAIFLSYSPTEDNKNYEATELKSTTSNYAIYDFLLALRIRHSAINRLVDVPLGFKISNLSLLTINLSKNYSVQLVKGKDQIVTFVFNGDFSKLEPELKDLLVDHLCLNPNVLNFDSLISNQLDIFTNIFYEVITNHILNDLVLMLGKKVINNDFGITVDNKGNFGKYLTNIGSSFVILVGDSRTLINPTDVRDLWQVDSTNKKTYHNLLQLSRTLIQLQGKYESSVVIDKQGKLLNKQKLSQLAGFIEENIYYQTLNASSPNSHTILKDIYRGTVLMRDAKSKKGEVKKVIEFSRHEHFKSSFIYDYLNNLFDNTLTTITIHGPVVSDKPFIIGIKVAKDKILHLLSKTDVTPDVLILQLKTLINQQLGAFYHKQLLKVNTEIRKINEGIDLYNQTHGTNIAHLGELTEVDGISLDSNVDEVLLLIAFREFNESINNSLLNPSESNRKTFIRELFKEIYTNNKNIKFISNFIGYYNSEGYFVPNPLLLYNLKRYNTDSIWYDESSDLFISDLIRDNVFIPTFIRLNDKKETIAEVDNYLCTLTINGLDRIIRSKSNLALSDPYLQFVNIYHFLENWKTYTQENNENEELNNLINSYKKGLIDNPKFSISSFVKILNSTTYKQLLTVYNKYKNNIKFLEAYAKYKLEENDLKLNKHHYYFKHFLNGKPLIFKNTKQTENTASIEFNPTLIKYNLFAHLIVESYLNAGVGTYLTHPLKGKTISAMMLGCRGAQVKRNVTFSATVHLFLTNRLDTVPLEVKCMIVPNLSNPVFNILGDKINEDGSTHYLLSDDGLTNVDPTYAYLENNSLVLNKVGGIKKEFGGYVDPETGTSLILKTSGLPLTNDWLRNSPRRLNLLRRMRSIPFNTTVDFVANLRTGEYINWDSLGIYVAIPVFNAEKGELTHTYKKLKNLTLLNGNNCTLEWVEVDKFGNEIGDVDPDPVSFNNLYDFWEHALGGMYSCKFAKNPDTNEYQLIYNNCDKSNELLAALCCWIGVKRDYSKLPYNVNDLILKRSLIGYAATEEAMKNGITNPNTKLVYEDGDYNISYMTFNAFDLGVQLDAEHSAFESRVSLMTLVVNALVARGYSILKGALVYNALYRITKLAIKDVIGDQVKSEKALNKLASLLLDVIASTKAGQANIFETLASKFKYAVKLLADIYNQLKRSIPVDDPSILRPILSKLTVSILQNGVRLKLPGGLFVLTPSDNYVQLYNGRPLNDYGGTLTESTQKYLQQLSNVSLKYLGTADLGAAQVQLGHSYIIKIKLLDGRIINKNYSLTTPNEYWNFVDDIAKIDTGVISLGNNTPPIENYTYAIYEDYTKPAELGCEDFIILSQGAKKNSDVYHIWDLYEVRKLWELCKKLKNKNLTPEDKKILLLALKENLVALLKQLNKLNDHNEEAKVSIGRIDEDGNLVKQEIFFDRQTVKYVPFLAIMPKYLKERFGLTDFDTLADIKEDKDFFTRRSFNLLKSVIKHAPDNAQLCVIGKHTIYLSKVNSINNDETVSYTLIDGECWYLDSAGNKLFRLPLTDGNKPAAKVSQTLNGDFRIETTDLNFFVNDSHYSLIYPIPNSNHDILKTALGEDIINLIIDEKTDFDVYISELNDILKLEFEDLIKKNSLYSLLKKNGSRIHTSFLDSLRFVASRTPAQCHQSFMAMECVAFNHVDTNEAQVSRWQLWLLGSDFDIDKVNIITHHVKNGKMLGWSPYLSYEKGIEWIDIANTLPLPSEKETRIIEVQEETKESIKFNNLIREIFPEIKLISYIKSISKDGIISDNDRGLLKVLYSEVFNKELKDDVDINVLLNTVKALFNKHLTSSYTLLIHNTKILRALSVYLNNLDSIIVYNNTADPDLRLSDCANLLKLVMDSHNLYMGSWKDSKKREAYENFVSKGMWLISADPRNWILGQISVDTSTVHWINVADKSKQAEAASRLTGDSAYGLLSLLVLTLEGRLNVGIVANSLKTFEAASLALYLILNSGDVEKIQLLFVDLQIGGHQLYSIANLWVKSEIFDTLPEDIQNILQVFASSDDAFIELSSLLSLAVDNAKNPTLSKINGNKNMIGLYTAGLIAGINREELIAIINSPSGELISEYLTSDIFNSLKVHYTDALKAFNNLNRLTFDSLINEIQDEAIKSLLTTDDILNSKNDSEKIVKALNKLLSEELAENQKEEIKKIINSLYNLLKIANIKDYDFYQDKDGNPHHTYYALNKLARVNAELRAVMIVAKLNLGYVNSVEELFDFVYSFSNILSSLNMYSIAKSDGSDKIYARQINRIHELLNLKKPDNLDQTPTLDLITYVNNPILYGDLVLTLLEYNALENKDAYQAISYREAVRNYYETKKYFLNIFDVFENAEQYKGYLEGMAAVIQGSRDISVIYDSIYKSLNPVIDTLKVTDKLNRHKVIKKIELYFHIKRNNAFWEHVGNKFTFTITYKGHTLRNVTLNTEKGRLIFKTYFENLVLPVLFKRYPDNKFILSLQFKLMIFPDHSQGRKISSRVSTRLTDPKDKINFDATKSDLNKLQYEDFNGVSISTLFFVYDLITTNGLNIRNSLAPFFEDLRYNDKNSFISKFEDFVKHPTDINGNLIETWFNENEIDQICKFCAPEVLVLNNNVSFKYVYHYDNNQKQFVLKLNTKKQKNEPVIIYDDNIDTDLYNYAMYDNEEDDFMDQYDYEEVNNQKSSYIPVTKESSSSELIYDNPNTQNVSVKVKDDIITTNMKDKDMLKILRNLIDADIETLRKALDQNC